MHGYGKVDVHVDNVFNTTHKILKNQLHTNIDKPSGYAVLNNINTWLFQERFLNVKINDNLVVIWRTKFISSTYPKFKDSYDDSYWDLIIPLLKMQGYTVMEITHKTPIREVFYLISICKFIIAYNGMYHYIAKNLIKPMIVMGDSNIIKTHNPQAVHFYSPKRDKTERKILDYILNIKKNTSILIDKTISTKKTVYPIVYGKEYE